MPRVGLTSSSRRLKRRKHDLNRTDHEISIRSQFKDNKGNIENFLNLTLLLGKRIKHTTTSDNSNRRVKSPAIIFSAKSKHTLLINQSSNMEIFRKHFRAMISGHMVNIVHEGRRTAKANWYTNICSPEVIREFSTNNPYRRIIQHRVNGRSHTPARTTKFLANESIELMHQPPYFLKRYEEVCFKKFICSYTCSNHCEQNVRSQENDRFFDNVTHVTEESCK